MPTLTPEQQQQWYRNRAQEQANNAVMLGQAGIPAGGSGAYSQAMNEAARYGSHITPEAGGGAGGAGSGDFFAQGAQRVQDLTNDPVDAMIRERLKGVMSGAIGPYDQKTREALATSQADQAAAAETAQNQALRDQIAMNGGSMNDPSAQAAMRDNLTQRQLANQGSRLNVDMNANLQNFNASQNAAGMLNQQNRGQQAAIGQASQYLGNMLAQRTTQMQQPDYTGLLSQFLGNSNRTATSMQPWVSPAYTSGGRSSNEGYLMKPAEGYTPVYGGPKSATSGGEQTQTTNYSPYVYGTNNPEYSPNIPSEDSFKPEPLPQGMPQKPKPFRPINPWDPSNTSWGANGYQ